MSHPAPVPESPASTTTHRGPDLNTARPATYKALVELLRTVRTANREAGLPAPLTELTNVLASHINGCVACLSVHSELARRAGVPQGTLDLLTAWRRADAFSPSERAALELTEVLTRPGVGGGVEGNRPLESAITAAREHFSTEQLAALEWSIITINTFNRVSIASDHPAIS